MGRIRGLDLVFFGLVRRRWRLEQKPLFRLFLQHLVLKGWSQAQVNLEEGHLRRHVGGCHLEEENADVKFRVDVVFEEVAPTRVLDPCRMQWKLSKSLLPV